MPEITNEELQDWIDTLKECITFEYTHIDKDLLNIIESIKLHQDEYYKNKIKSGGI